MLYPQNGDCIVAIDCDVTSFNNVIRKRTAAMRPLAIVGIAACWHVCVCVCVWQQQGAGLLAEPPSVAQVGPGTPLPLTCLPPRHQHRRVGPSALPRPHHRRPAARPAPLPHRLRLRARPDRPRRAESGGRRSRPSGGGPALAGPPVLSPQRRRRGGGRRRPASADRSGSARQQRDAEPRAGQDRASGLVVTDVHLAAGYHQTSQVHRRMSRPFYLRHWAPWAEWPTVFSCRSIKGLLASDKTSSCLPLL